MDSATSMTTQDRLTRIVSAGRTNRLPRDLGCGLGDRYVTIVSAVSGKPTSARILRVWYPPAGFRNVSIESGANGRRGWVGRRPEPAQILSIVFDIPEGGYSSGWVPTCQST